MTDETCVLCDRPIEIEAANNMYCLRCLNDAGGECG